MTARDTYNASVATALATKVASNTNNTLTAQETINVTGVNAGLNPARGASAAFDAAVRTSNATLYAARKVAEMTKQVAIQAAKDTLRATGDSHPA